MTSEVGISVGNYNRPFTCRDFDSDDLELLNRSCSEDDDSDVEYDDGKDDEEEEDDHEEDEDDDDEDDDDGDDDDDDVPEGEDIVKDFTMSSDEDDS